MAIGREGPLPFHGRERACLRVGSVIVNGLNALGRRRELVENFRRVRLDVMRIQETHTKGC